MDYSALVYCNTFFFSGRKVLEMPIFSPFWTMLSHNAITPSRVQDALFFMFNVFPHSDQAFMHFGSIFGLL